MVELRSCSHLHCIRTIKDGTIKSVMNVAGKGKSKLRFRQLVDIYNSENIRGVEPIARIQPRQVVRDLEHVSEKAEVPCLSGAEANIKPEPEDFDMTLENVRRQCKGKKRKRRNRIDAEADSVVEVKKECLSLQTEDEGCDLEEPLSKWNTKFSKKRKKNKERKTMCGSTSSPSVEKVGFPVFCDVKPEPSEDSYSVPEAMNFTPTDLLRCNEEQESVTNTESVEETICDSSKDTRLVLYCNTEPNSPGMVANEEPITTKPVEKAFTDTSEEFNNARKTQCCLADNIALENHENVLLGSVSREEAEFELPQSSESEIVSIVPISSYTISGGKEAKGDEENNDSDLSIGMNITGLEIVKIEAPEILAIDYSGLPAMGFEVENTEIVKIEAPEILAIDYPGLPTMGSGVENTKIVWETEDIAKDDLPEGTDIIHLTNCFNSLVHLQTIPDDCTISAEEHQLADDEQLYKAPDEVTTDAETDDIQQLKPPGKLLSGRKALSPTSQTKLRKAMEQPDSPEKKKSKKSKGKLYFSSQNSHRILKAQGLDNIDRVEVIPNTKQAIQKANNNTRQTHYPRATHKFPRRATKQQPFGSGCTSLQGCTQKAIAFSQGQMRDFQYVAARLREEIKSMKKITKRCLLADSNTSNISECDFNEVKTFIENAERTEKNSKKWLSMIERDCNRFCKVMGMVTEDSPATENIVHKKKKIKFADDAGGDLCHVKVFED